MKLLDGHLRHSATDIANFLACRHLTRLDFAAAHGLVEPPRLYDVGMEALSRRGDQHEARLLEEFQGQGWTVEKVSDGGTDFHARAEATKAALDSGVDVIYQGALLRDRRLGLPDFLIRADLLGGTDGYYRRTVKRVGPRTAKRVGRGPGQIRHLRPA